MKERIAANLLHYRTVCGWSQDETAERIGISRLAYLNAEKGKSMPGDDFLNSACEAFRVQMRDLIDTVEVPAVSFLSNQCATRRASAERIETIRRAWRRARDIRFLLELSGRSVAADEARLADFRRKVRADRSMAQSARRELWPDGLSHLESLPKVLDANGIIVCFLPFVGKAVDGFSFDHPETGCVIVVNSSPEVTSERKVMALAHELGHVIHETMNEDHGSRRTGDGAEAEAVDFARDFLLPRELFERIWRDMGPYKTFDDKVLEIKGQFKVSYSLVVFRAQAARFCDKNGYGRFLSAMKRRGFIGPEPAPVGLRLVMDGYDALACEAYEKQEVTLSRFAELMMRPVSAVREILANKKKAHG